MVYSSYALREPAVPTTILGGAGKCLFRIMYLCLDLCPRQILVGTERGESAAMPK